MTSRTGLHTPGLHRAVSWVFFRREKIGLVLLWGVEVYPPLEWVGAVYGIFYQDFFSSAGRIGHFSSPCALPPEKMIEKPRLTVCTRPPAPGLSFRQTCEDEGGMGVPPSEGVWRNQEMRVLAERASPPPSPSFPLTLCSFGSISHCDLCQHIY